LGQAREDWKLDLSVRGKDLKLGPIIINVLIEFFLLHIWTSRMYFIAGLASTWAMKRVFQT
jgi:hypothetical protein